MTDQEDNKPVKKSIANLESIPGGGESKKPVAKLKNKDIHFQMASAMSGHPMGWHRFPMKLHRVVDFRGENLAYVENQNRIVQNVSDAFLNTAITSYWNADLKSGDNPIYLPNISDTDITKIRRLWYAMAPAVTKPFPLITWASDPRPSHHKVPFDPLPIDELEGAAPLFSELLGRMTNAQSFMAFIGSLFDEASQRQQYVWIHGEGRNGKGALIRALGRVLGPVMSADQPPERGAKHWTVGLLGKRLAVFPDCEDATFARTGLFKSLTGEDQIRVEIKGGSILFLDLPVKFIFTSNKKPDISSGKADMRRIIFCPIEPVAEYHADYERRLEKEIPAFISVCWNTYKSATKGDPRADIPITTTEEVESLAERNEYDCAAFVDAYLTIHEDKGDLPYNKKPHVRAGDMMKLMNHMGFRTKYERIRLIEYLQTKHGVFYKSIKVEHTYKAYINCALNASAHGLV